MSASARVVAADRDHRQAVAVPAPEAPQRLSEHLADEIPDREVDARARDQAEAPVTEDVERRGPRKLPAALDRQRVLPDQDRSDFVVDDPLDLEQAGVLVAGVGLADEAVDGHPHDHGRAVGHVVVRAPIDALERDPDRRRLDADDRQ